MTARILFLCTGNICRSPVAEAVARQMFGHLGLVFESSGLDASPGLPASLESARYCRETGTDLESHGSRPVTGNLTEGAAWVIGMTRGHVALFRSRFGAAFTGSIGVLGAPGVDLSVTVHSPPVEEVPDPYGGSAATYGQVCDQIRHLLAGWDSCFLELADGKDQPR